MLCAGSNDVVCDEAFSCVKHIRDTVGSLWNTNIIILAIPLSYMTIFQHCTSTKRLRKQIEKLGKQIEKLGKQWWHIVMQGLLILYWPYLWVFHTVWYALKSQIIEIMEDKIIKHKSWKSCKGTPKQIDWMDCSEKEVYLEPIQYIN